MAEHWQDGDTKIQVGRALHLLAALLTLIVGLIHVFQKSARVHWPSNFIDDINLQNWRDPMFSLAPSIFIDNWTPFVLGLWGILAHLKGAGDILGAPTTDFLNAAVYLIIMGLWGTIAYAGGIGIIFSCFTWLACAACIALTFTDNKSASLMIQ